ncbi:S49 family peptidase [Salinispirillum sp. LH 10-3-1]|uniref:S49 family peptidase n=1 Tax=Salinispirillum sp. LH 10-3-1 TaxID=2952525 RepID=A0AB38YIV0_9GAMM
MTSRTASAALSTLFICTLAHAEGIGFQRYYEKNEFLLASPGALKFGHYGYDNPAGLHHLKQGDILFSWTSDDFLYDDQRWNTVLAAPGVSFTFGRDNRGAEQVRDYTLAMGGGTDDAAAGFSIGWYRGDTDTQDLRTHFTLGTLTRPSRNTSIGLTGTIATDTRYYEGTADVAYRPLGSTLLTVFADYATGNDQGLTGGQWSAGGVSEVLPGIRVAGRYFDSGALTAGLQISFGHAGISAQSHHPEKNNASYQSYAVRLGAWDRNLMDALVQRQDRYLELTLNQEITYQTFGIFDRRHALLDTLRYIEAARQDDTIGGIVINTTQLQVPAALAWEIKDSLDDFRASGKQVVLYIENGGMTELLLSSAADVVFMDPAGTLTLPGFVSGTTYVADLLAHWGVGVDEFRNLEYKTAFENLSRYEMSDPDREQRQAIIDGFYALWQTSMENGRGLSADDFDRLIDRGIYLSPQDLVNAGVVNKLARYTDVDDVLEKMAGSSHTLVSPSGLSLFRTPLDNHWGPAHRIAVLYATGMTATDMGMRTRQLARNLEALREDDSIKAVVIRVDSPGGGILAADLLAEQVKETQAQKPVVISMGSLATSGGYWVAMHAGTLVAAPNTITGSIGVTGVRLWDNGLGQRLNLNSDFVSRGASSDVGFGIGLPLLGIALPHRDLTTEERAGIMQRIDGWYDDFVTQAAEARSKPHTRMRELAAGRIYTGTQAQELGLIDDIGNLSFAIDLARQQAGISPKDKILVVEGPARNVSALNELRYLVMANHPVSWAQNNAAYHHEYLQFLVEQRGQPMVLLPYEYFGEAVRYDGN